MFNDWSFPLKLKGLISTISISDILEIVLVAVIFYKLYKVIEDTRAITLAKGIFVLFFVNFLCSTLFNLPLLSWIFEKFMTWIFVALPIVFQPELRRTLERLGQGRFLFEKNSLDEEEAQKIIDEIITATKSLAATKTGALMVIERRTGLNDIASTGIILDARITSELLLNIFFVNTPLHDGATIIRGKRVFAAACLLPLTEKEGLTKELGTRHRAAIGLSEQYDALILVVSEETGTISIAENGRLMRHLNEETLESILKPAFTDMHQRHWFDFLAKWRNEK